MISLGGLMNQKAFGKFEMGKVISNPFASAFIKEGEDHEVSMGQNQLDTIIKMATELKAKMGEDEKEIPAWIQDHISKAENYISQAAGNYHEYGTNESVNEGKFYAFFNNKKHEIEAKDLWDAKQKAITMLKVPKSKVGYLAIVNAKEHDGGSYRFESIDEAMSARTPKIFVKTAAVEKKIKELMADRKKAVVPYNNETDPAKKEKLKQILIKLTNQIKGYERNLVQLRDREEEYLQQLHADAELDTTGL